MLLYPPILNLLRFVLIIHYRCNFFTPKTYGKPYKTEIVWCVGNPDHPTIRKYRITDFTDFSEKSNS